MSVRSTITLSIQSACKPLRIRKRSESREESWLMGYLGLPLLLFAAIQRQPNQVFQFVDALLGYGADEDVRHFFG